MRSAISLAGILAMLPFAATAQEKQAKEDYKAFSRLVHSIVVKQLPKELEDAAEIDGCSRLRVFRQIFLPNAGPVLAASAIFAFQWVWGDFFLQTIFLTESHATLAMKLASAYADPHGNPLYTQTLAAVVIYVLPLIVVFFVAQKSIVRGVVTTGLK